MHVRFLKWICCIFVFSKNLDRFSRIEKKSTVKTAYESFEENSNYLHIIDPSFVIEDLGKYVQLQSSRSKEYVNWFDFFGLKESSNNVQ